MQKFAWGGGEISATCLIHDNIDISKQKKEKTMVIKDSLCYLYTIHNQSFLEEGISSLLYETLLVV